MIHIKDENGRECNLLALTLDEAEALEAFLNNLGVRIRPVYWSGDIVFIQAENVYERWIDDRGKRLAAADMTEKAKRAYKC